MIEFTAHELFILLTAFWRSTPRDLGDLREMDRLLDRLEFTDDEKARMQWQDNGPMFEPTVTVHRELSDAERERALQIMDSQVPLFILAVRKDALSVIDKLGGE